MTLLVRPTRFPVASVLLGALLLLCSVSPEWLPTPASWPPVTRAEAAHQAPPEAEFVPGEVLVGLRGGGPPAPLDLASALPPDCPIALKETVGGLGVLRLQVPVGREMEVVERLQGSPLVEWAEPNYLRGSLWDPNDQLYRQFQWNMRKIQAERAWDIATGSSDVTVAVLDTGIDASHPDLAGKLVAGYDFLNDDPDPADDSGHGTHNAGIIGAASNNGVGVAGVAWGTKIMPLKVLNSSGVGPDSVIARGIVYATDHGARVINMSLGSSTSSRVLARAVQYAYDRGALLVAAAGNTARLDNAPVYPAAYEQVLAVGATDEEDKVADFSQHHPYVGVCAPGVRIVSTFWRGAGYGAYVSASGTSSAAPHVSGLAALIWSISPALTNQQVRQIIEETVDDLGKPGRDEFYGNGRVNAYKALLSARPAAPPSPTVAPPSATPIPSPTPAPPAAPAPTPATLPRAAWYFAEGSTARPFDLWLLLQNPNAAAATAKVTYMKPDGTQVIREEWLPPNSRKSVLVNQVVPETELSIKVESDSLLFAERAMYFRTDGHDTVGATVPSTQWYMAEGSSRGDFDTWILLQNPLNGQARATVTFLTSEGHRKEMEVLLPPTSRRSIYANQVIPDAEFSTVVLSDQPIVAERSMYFRQSGGHGSIAASQLAKNWYLAEGQTGDGYDTWLLVLNPNQAAANLKVTLFREDGTTSEGHYAALPGSRLSIYANNVVPSGRFGIQVESDQPIAVERSLYFAGGKGGHNVVAAPLLSQEWYLPEGSTRPPFTEKIAVLNPNAQVANLAVVFMKEGGGSESRQFVLGPTSRTTLNVNELMPDAEISTKVTSDVPIAVERSMYFANGLGGTGSFGIPR